MTDPLIGNTTVTFPPPRADIAHTECAAGSQRDPDETLAQPCHVCGHVACRIAPQGPVPCETCGLVVYVRRIASGASLGTIDVVGQLRQRVDELGRAVEDLTDRIDRATAFPI